MITLRDVGTVETFEPFTFEIADPFEAMSKPWTLRPVKVPTDVMFGWEAVITLRDVGTVETFEPFTFEIADPFEAMSKPWTLRPVKVPTDVMFPVKRQSRSEPLERSRRLNP